MRLRQRQAVDRHSAPRRKRERLDCNRMRLEVTHAQAAKQPEQQQDDEDHTDDAAQTGQAVASMRVVSSAAAK